MFRISGLGVIFTGLVLIGFVAFSPVEAVETKLPQAQEERARGLFAELRCVVCQNQSIDSSDADVARDLRQIVREQIAAGKSDAEIRSYLVDRYGAFILLKPEFNRTTSILWAAPLIVLLVGGFLLFMRFRRPVTPGQASASAELNDEEKAELAKILKRQQEK